MVVERADVEPRHASTNAGDIFEGRRHGRASVAETDQLHTVVVGQARAPDRGAEPLRHADDDRCGAQCLGCLVGAAQSVLNGDHVSTLTKKRRHAFGRRGRHASPW